MVGQFFMKKIRILMATAAILAATALNSRAQTNIVTLTNLVTVTVTNVVTITNSVATQPASAAETKPVVEKMPKYPWESSITLGLTLTRGNSHTLLYTGSFRTDKKTPDNEYKFGADGAYGSQNSMDNVNNYGGFGQWNHLFTDKFYGYLRADALRDVIADLDYRVNVGPGVGYYLIKEANTTFAVEGGGGMQYEHLGDNYSSYGTMRFAENFEHKFDEHARIWEKAEILPQVDKFQNYVVNAEIGVETLITASISLKTYLDDTYLTEPAAGRYRNDVKLVSGLSYKF